MARKDWLMSRRKGMSNFIYDGQGSKFPREEGPSLNCQNAAGPGEPASEQGQRPDPGVGADKDNASA